MTATVPKTTERTKALSGTNKYKAIITLMHTVGPTIHETLGPTKSRVSTTRASTTTPPNYSHLCVKCENIIPDQHKKQFLLWFLDAVLNQLQSCLWIALNTHVLYLSSPRQKKEKKSKWIRHVNVKSSDHFAESTHQPAVLLTECWAPNQLLNECCMGISIT